MADTKITALTAIGANPIIPSTFPIPMVDLSDTSMAASGTTKKVTVNQILGAGGTATLASATITGDLTVDTSTLKVDSANNRVGIRTASPAATLSVVGSAGTGNTVAGISGNTDSGLLSIGNDNSNGGAGSQTWTGSAQSYAAAISFGQVNTTGVREQTRTHATLFSTNIQSFGRADLVIATKGSADNNDPTEKYRIASDGVATWSNVGGVAGTAMTLNSTGLGVGRTPSTYKLEVLGNAQVIQSNFSDVAFRISQGASTSGNKGQLLFTDSSGTTAYITGYGSAFGSGLSGALAIGVGASDRMIVDTSGNVGIGVTPSAWVAGSKMIDLGAGSAVGNAGSTTTTWFTSNAYQNGTNWIYKNSAAASYYAQVAGQHQWHNAPSGTAGNPISGANAFVQAMTLDASGLLLVNTSSVIGGSGDTLQIAGKTTAGTDYCSMYTGTSTTVYAARYYHTSAVVGSITFTALGTAYNIASDYRLKESVKPLFGGLDRINALKPSTYKWKVNGSDGEGFIAHELAEVIPAAVTGQKDAVNEDGSIQPQQVDLSKVVPVLVAAIQELSAEVNALKNA